MVPYPGETLLAIPLPTKKKRCAALTPTQRDRTDDIPIAPNVPLSYLAYAIRTKEKRHAGFDPYAA